MRSRTKFFALGLVFLAGCTPAPHPTHPTKIDCTYEIETQFQARIDHSPPGGTNQGEDPCITGGPSVSLETWPQIERPSVPFCVAAATTPEQAATFCTNRLRSLGVNVGASAPPGGTTGFDQLGRRICPGSAIALSARYTAVLGVTGSTPEGCRVGTTWPLLP